MNMHDLHRYQVEKDHQMRNGHLTKADADTRAYHRYGFLNQEDKQYHSPPTPETMEGEY